MVIVTTCEGKQVKARVLGSDYTGFISVLEIDDNHISTLPPIASLESIHPGNEVFFLGVIPGMSLATNPGIIGTIRPFNGTFEVKTSGNPGTSGPPVFDKNKNVLGLLAFQIDNNDKASGTETAEKTYLVISLKYASVLARQVINIAEDKCGWLGLGICPKNSGENKVLIQKVIKDSPAYKNGIKPEDRIIEFNSIAISSPHQFIEAFIKTKPGDKISIKILRENKPLSFNITLDKRTYAIQNR